MIQVARGVGRGASYRDVSKLYRRNSPLGLRVDHAFAGTVDFLLHTAVQSAGLL
jgi:hypothetical protein